MRVTLEPDCPVKAARVDVLLRETGRLNRTDALAGPCRIVLPYLRLRLDLKR